LFSFAIRLTDNLNNSTRFTSSPWVSRKYCKSSPVALLSRLSTLSSALQIAILHFYTTNRIHSLWREPSTEKSPKIKQDPTAEQRSTIRSVIRARPSARQRREREAGDVRRAPREINRRMFDSNSSYDYFRELNLASNEHYLRGFQQAEEEHRLASQDARPRRMRHEPAISAVHRLNRPATPTSTSERSGFERYLDSVAVPPVPEIADYDPYPNALPENYPLVQHHRRPIRRPAANVDGLGDRERSLSPDDNWETMISSMHEDSVTSSMSSASIQATEDLGASGPNEDTFEHLLSLHGGSHHLLRHARDTLQRRSAALAENGADLSCPVEEETDTELTDDDEILVLHARLPGPPAEAASRGRPEPNTAVTSATPRTAEDYRPVPPVYGYPPLGNPRPVSGARTFRSLAEARAEMANFLREMEQNDEEVPDDWWAAIGLPSHVRGLSSNIPPL
jgi:hypothetical protein